MPQKREKKGKKGKKGSKSKAPVKIDGLSTEDMSPDQLREHVGRLQEELEREREERNYFQLERDKVNTFWEITKRQLDERKAELRNKDREMEDSEERHQIEIKVYKQKVKHLLYEHQNSLSELKAENTVQLELAQEEHYKEELGLRKDKRHIKVDAKETQLAHENLARATRIKNDANITALREDFETRTEQIEQMYEDKMSAQFQDLDLRRKTEMRELEERKNGQINTLMRNHEKAFSEIKNYYNDITLNNLSLINTLKEQMEEMRNKEERTEKQMAEIQLENRRLLEPLNKAKDEVDNLTRQLANYNKDKQSLASTKARLKVEQERHKALIWEHEVLQQRFLKIEEERDQLYKNLVNTIHEVQQKAGFKNLLLEKKLATLSESLEMKEAQINEVLVASNLDPNALDIVNHKLEDVLNSKNSAIKDLQYELARVCKAHNDLIHSYEGKLAQFGIPKEELGFRPLETSNTGAGKLGSGPAGLVAATS